MRLLMILIILPAVFATMHTEGNQIYRDGEVFYAQGVNIHDQRSCSRCAGWNGLEQAPRVEEVKRRIDLAIEWNATIIRLLMESIDTVPDHGDVTENPDYLEGILDIVDFALDKNLTVLLSSWIDTTDEGRPNQRTVEVFSLLEQHIDSPYVIFGLVNEPTLHYSEQEYYFAYNQTVTELRLVTDRLIAVQGRQWARDISYYVDHPLGANIVYETHQYNPKEDFDRFFLDASESLPVIVGEFGPFSNMDDEDIKELVKVCRQRGIPWIAWTLHQACPPNLLEELPGDQCGGSNPMPLNPSNWGNLVIELLNPNDIFGSVYKWKNGQITIEELMSAIGEWKNT